MRELIEKLIEAAREYGADASLETANAEMDAQIALFAALGRKDEEYRQLCAELAAARAEVERLRALTATNAMKLCPGCEKLTEHEKYCEVWECRECGCDSERGFVGLQ